MKNKKNYKFIIFLFVFLFSGCSMKETLKSLDDFLGEQMTDNAQTEGTAETKEPKEASEIDLENITYKDLTKEQKDLIDEWLKNNGYNRYGDSAGVLYTGGTPLFNELTGETTDRFEYILKNHPEILSNIQ